MSPDPASGQPDTSSAPQPASGPPSGPPTISYSGAAGPVEAPPKSAGKTTSDATLTHRPTKVDEQQTLDYPLSPAGDRKRRDDKPIAKKLGDFLILREIGRGGMGTVFEAVQESLGRKVALKVLRGAAMLDKDAIQRFHREAEAIARLAHPNIIPVYSVGEQEGTHYFAMQLVEGVSLAEVISTMRHGSLGHLDPLDPRCHATMTVVRRNVAEDAEEPKRLEEARKKYAAADTRTHLPKSLPTPSLNRQFINTAVEMIAQIADALAHAHAHGVIHRDIKPSNLLLSGPGKLMLTDFGLARQEGVQSLTYTGVFMGTPMYVSPEQAMAGKAPIDLRTDIYSLGATLYELLTLRPPCDSRDTHSVLREVISKEPRSFRKLNLRLPRDLETVTFKALEKSPERRYQSAQEFAEDLRRFLNYQAVQAKPPGAWTRALRLVQRHRRSLTIAAGAVLLAFLSAFLVVGQWQREQTQKATTFVEQGLDLLQRAQAAPKREEFERLSDEALDQFTSALAIDGTNAQALEGRLTTHVQRCQRALERGDFEVARGIVLLLKELDQRRTRGAEIAKYERRVLGGGTWRIETIPTGCRVAIARLDENFQTGKPKEIGVTPLDPQDIAMGSYLVTVTHPEYPEVRYPLFIERNEEKSFTVAIVAKEQVPPGMVYVPAGDFLYGDPHTGNMKRVLLPGFFMDAQEVTGEEYAKFIQATGTPPPERWQGSRTCPPHLRDSAVYNISWFEALEYARWAGKRLPTEAEWEKAARGVDGRSFPWGQRFERRRCNCRDTSDRTGLAVGAHRSGESPYGCLDMAGNVWEWTLDREKPAGAARVIRGGAAYCSPEELLVFRRQGAPPGGSSYGGFNLIGFRCVKPLEPEPLLSVFEQLKSSDDFAEAAEFYWDHEQFDRVQECVRRLLQLNSRSVQGNYWKGLLHAKEEKPADALAAWKIVYFQRPRHGVRGHAPVFENIRRAAGELEKAGQKVDKSFWDVPRFLLTAEQASDKGEHREAEGHLQKVLEIDPDNAIAHEKIAEVYTALGQADEAAKYHKRRTESYRIQLREDPDNGELHNEFAAFLTQNDLDLAEALALAQRAVELDADNAEFHGTLADVLHRLKRTPEAVTHIQRAIDLDPEEDAYREQLREFQTAVKRTQRKKR